MNTFARFFTNLCTFYGRTGPNQLTSRASTSIFECPPIVCEANICIVQHHICKYFLCLYEVMTNPIMQEQHILLPHFQKLISIFQTLSVALMSSVILCTKHKPHFHSEFIAYHGIDF